MSPNTRTHFLTNTDFFASRRTDIRKPATRKAQIQRPANSHSASTTNSPSEAASHSTADLAHYTEPVSDDEADEDNRHQAVTLDEAGWADLPPQAAAEAKAFRDEQAKRKAGEDAGKPGKSKQQEIFPKLTPANLTKLLESKYETERDRGLNEHARQVSGGADEPGQQNGHGAGGEESTVNPSTISLRPGRIEYVSSFRAQPGKRIAVPVRVEPKVFYANERTSMY